MPQDLIRYDLLVQDALKGVVRKVLNDATTQGMPGEHHFYISFRTHDAGVRISQRLRDKYPDEMTIVLQHQFWDLAVTEHAFEVGLSFSGIPERLLIPFDSLTGFFDPSVQFGLKFELSTTEPADNDEGGGEDGDDEANVPATLSNAPVPMATPARKPAEVAAARKLAERATAEGAGEAKPFEAKPLPKAKTEALKSDGKPALEPARPKGKAEAEKPGKDAGKDAGAEVVSLDSFRKKP